MDRFFRRSMNKKGFTMVELIIVIAIIGVIAAMFLPNLFTSDVPAKAKGYAKSYYFTVQEFFSRQKVGEDPNTPVFATHIPFWHFYTQVDSTGRVIECGSVSGGDTMITVADIQSSGAADGYKQMMLEFEEYMEKFLTDCDYEGYYYCTVDDRFRVQATYWSEADIATLISESSDLSFTDDYLVGGYWCASYPAENSQVAGSSSTKMFVPK